MHVRFVICFFFYKIIVLFKNISFTILTFSFILSLLISFYIFSPLNLFIFFNFSLKSIIPFLLCVVILTGYILNEFFFLHSRPRLFMPRSFSFLFCFVIYFFIFHFPFSFFHVLDCRYHPRFFFLILNVIY